MKISGSLPRIESFFLVVPGNTGLHMLCDKNEAEHCLRLILWLHRLDGDRNNGTSVDPPSLVR